MSRWTPETRSVERIEEPSTRSDRQRVAKSLHRDPHGAQGAFPGDPEEWRRTPCTSGAGCPWRSFPHPMVRPPQSRHVGAVDGYGGIHDFFSDLELL